jgi:hypothetical protein
MFTEAARVFVFGMDGQGAYAGGIKQLICAGSGGAAERPLGRVNQSAQGGIDGLLVEEMLSDVRGEQCEVRSRAIAGGVLAAHPVFHVGHVVLPPEFLTAFSFFSFLLHNSPCPVTAVLSAGAVSPAGGASPAPTERVVNEAEGELKVESRAKRGRNILRPYMGRLGEWGAWAAIGVPGKNRFAGLSI